MQETQSDQNSNDDARLARKIKLEMRPFHLRADQRVRERREYDASVQQNMAQKKKEVNCYCCLLFIKLRKTAHKN